MREAGIGRVLVASLHQAIGDILPGRLAFYENWLSAKGMREGTIGLAPTYAVLSFLRQEGGDAYQIITTRAGEYAAEWTVQAMPPLQRAALKAAPQWLRRRLVLRLARRVVRSSYRGSRAISRLGRETASVDVRASIFCTVRELAPRPLCGFYAAAFTRLLLLFHVPARTDVIACRGTGEATCLLKVALLNGRTRSLVERVVLIAVLAGSAVASVAGQAPPAARILVLPFDNVNREASIFWLGEASAVVLADDLNALGAGAIIREERREAFERLQVPATAILSNATVIRIGQLVGASEVVTGTLQLEDDTLVVHARGIALETGRVSSDAIERGPVPQMFEIFERVARRLAPAGAGPAADGSHHPPLDVFENYIKGLLAEIPATAINYLNAALTALPSFDRARLALWDIYTEQGDHAKALAAAQPVAGDSIWSRRARFLAALSSLNLNRFDEAFAGFNGLVDAQPAAMALNNLGVVQIRRGPTSQNAQPTYYFGKAAEADPSDADYFFNLGYAYWLARDAQAATYWLREAVRRNPADGDAHFVLGASLAAAGSSTEASRERELARRLSSRYEQWEKRPAADAVPKGLERVKDGVELPHARQVEAALATSDQRELARFHLDRGRRLFQQENDREAIVELNRALYLSPYEADAHLLLGRIHLRNNRLREALDSFKISLWSLETPQAHVALGEAYVQAKDPAAARAEAERALMLDPSSSDAKQLLGRIAGQ
jgi:tetratricopeptide (TPR) repeat protein